MTIQIGRLEFPNPTDISFNGTRLELEGWITGTTRELVSHYRDSLLSYMNNFDEPNVGIVWADDPFIDGWYRIDDVAVTPIVGVSEHNDFRVQYSLSAELLSRVGTFESVTVGGFRTNSHGYTATSGAIPSHIPPPNSVDYYNSTDTSGPITRSTDDGEIDVYDFDSPSAVERRVVTYAHHVDATYLAQARVDVALADGSTFVTRVGRGTPPGVLASGATIAAADAVRSWKVGNGIVEFGWVGPFDTWAFFVWDQIADTYQTFLVAFPETGTNKHRPTSMAILRNSPERVTVRASCNDQLAAGNAITPSLLDISLRRGSPFVEFNLQYVDRSENNWAVSVESGTANVLLSGSLIGSTVVGGMARSTPATNSYSWYVFTAASLSGGAPYAVLSTNAANFDFAIGALRSGVNTYLTHFAEYMAPIDERVRLVAR